MQRKFNFFRVNQLTFNSQKHGAISLLDRVVENARVLAAVRGDNLVGAGAALSREPQSALNSANAASVFTIVSDDVVHESGQNLISILQPPDARLGLALGSTGNFKICFSSPIKLKYTHMLVKNIHYNFELCG